jgi:putative ABC transport system permease protein
MGAAVGWLLFRRFSLRHWRVAPGQSALLVLILALGVGVFLAIRLANRAAVASFSNFTDTLIGQSDWIVEAPSGTLPEPVLPELRAALGTRPVIMVPVVESTAALPLRGTQGYYDRKTYTVLGVDLIGISNLAAARAAVGHLSSGGSGEDFWTAFRSPDRVWVPSALAQRKNLRLLIEDQSVTLPVAGAIQTTPGTPAPPDTLIIMDLPDLQRLAGKQGKLDRIEFVAAPGPNLPARRAELGALLTHLGGDGDRWMVRSPGLRRETADKMTEAFRVNLTILSLIALLVGLYLIFQALDGAVVRRRGEIAILRSLGVEEATIRRLWLAEAALLGLAGGLLGVVLGWAGAQGAVRAIGRTVNTLYFATTVSTAQLDPAEIWLGLALGVIASVAAGWWPAREAARTPPAQVLGRSAALGPGIWQKPGWGLAALVLGLGLIRLPAVRLSGGARFPLAGYLAALAWIFGGGVFCASALPALARTFRALGNRQAPARVAMGHLARPSGRHRLAIASLLCAVGMSAGMAILVASFERTVRLWVAHSLQADLYVYSAAARNAAGENHLAAPVWRALAARPEVEQAWMLAAYPIQIGTGAPALLTGTNLYLTHTRSELPWVERPADDTVFDPAHNAKLALVSESFSDRFERHRGDSIVLPTPLGPQTMTVAGVYADYGNERGTVMVQWEQVVKWMHDDAATHVSLFLKPGINAELLRARLRKQSPGLQIITYRELRGQILNVFRQTFTITYALEIIGVIVAVAGLALAMASILLDRRDELTSLRALGFTRREMAQASSLEGAALAVWAVGGGLILSLALGWLLVHVINKQSFGWTLGFALPLPQLAILAIAVILTGWTVSYAVGWWGANLPADQEE